jgi:hypothetical protein
MAMSFELHKKYNFNTLAPSILGSGFKNVLILAIIDYTVASTYSSIQAWHTNVYPYLPAGTPKDPTKYTYILFRTEVNTNIVLALPWIDLTTISEVTQNHLTVVINNVTPEDITRVSESLTLLGLTSFTLTQS